MLERKGGEEKKHGVVIVPSLKTQVEFAKYLVDIKGAVEEGNLSFEGNYDEGKYGQIIGIRLFNQLKEFKKGGKDIQKMKTQEFMACLFQTAEPTIYPEDGGDGTKKAKEGWTEKEYNLLANSQKMLKSVTVHHKVTRNNSKDTLISPDSRPEVDCVFFNALLFNDNNPMDLERCLKKPLAKGQSIKDFVEQIKQEQQKDLFDKYVDFDKYKSLLSERLLSVLKLANEENPKGFILTIPALGCSAFAGIFQGTDGKNMRKYFEQAFKKIIAENQSSLTNLKAIVYTDGEESCKVADIEGTGIPFIETNKSIGTAPLLDDEIGAVLREKGCEGCRVVVGVAGDPFACTNNDYNAGKTTTHEGGVGSTTNATTIATEVEGEVVQEGMDLFPMWKPKSEGCHCAVVCIENKDTKGGHIFSAKDVNEALGKINNNQKIPLGVYIRNGDKLWYCKVKKQKVGLAVDGQPKMIECSQAKRKI
ncbi:MAG: hypothetical protein KIT56_04950 [Gammaproteobacteria bacterium]|nr:hypothetical protein [Gammaproteobacteria bacterium]